MTGLMSRYLAIPEQTPAMILLFESRLSSFYMIYLRISLLYHNTLKSSMGFKEA